MLLYQKGKSTGFLVEYGLTIVDPMLIPSFCWLYRPVSSIALEVSNSKNRVIFENSHKKKRGRDNPIDNIYI